ncbi:MAG TPA: LiaF-related protein [Anaerolineae bacterium]|nr:LiaF-related protein [Anaerolineae bacterium]
MKTLAGSAGLVRAIILVLLLGAMIACSGSSQGQLLTDDLSQPLNGATTAKLDVDCGPGHLAIDRLTGGEPLLAGGTLQYFERQGPPNHTLSAIGSQTTFTLQDSGSATAGAGFRWPWQACAGGAFEWLLHLNPTVSYDIAAHSDGGNVTLDLAGMAVSRVTADTAGGDVDVVLPDNAADLSVTAKTGAGNVTVSVPSGVAAKIHASSGLGKVIVDPRFSKLDDNTYQSPDYDAAANRVEITASSGAGNVSVITR